ncbi:GNAT family N-acetyltransferase [Microtetraspora niveoalba]|uniref:GNAT family N-acetyltransferase n=1 Tax=Microtetraspora niveoalba TaxID=46175 RepID=UPI000A912E9B|nr:GNAT family N-acetyltransferase [Microtetraspora niveoalba]
MSRDADADTRADAGTGADADTRADAGTGADADTGADAGTGADADTGADGEGDDEAWAAAEEAAALCRVRVRELREIADFERVIRVFDEIWHPEPANPPITVELMRALSHAGNYVAGAFDGDTLVGASAGFFASPAGEALHSHVTGAVRRGAGFALKLHQRAWALRRGLTRITWTFDPLVRRNAHFNLAKLGALPEEYLRDFYGPMADAVNTGDESDRVLAVWRLDAPHVVRACRREPYLPEVPPGAVRGISHEGGRPAVHVVDGVPGDGEVVLVAVPEDVESLRRSDPGAAAAWRHAVREVLGGLMEGGARVIGFARGHYVARTG